MAETSLYRKYRPHTFDEVVGQRHITDVLSQSIKNNSYSHAYLFSGTRGVGKTSVARIFAQEIGTKPHDLYEIDAASNRGVDDIRELREGVRALPYDSPKKLYIIDEAHMLTREAFNALLKTLEEPPEHVVFILATTEPEKIPDTILSRCSIFQFRAPTADTLRETILDIAKKEKLELDKSSAELVATLANGSFRDALSTLQKLIAAKGSKKMSAEEVERILGAPKSTLLFDFLGAISNGDLAKALEVIERVKDAGVDISLFHKLILSRLRAVLVIRFGSQFLKDELTKQFSSDDLKYLEKLAKEARNINSALLKEFLDIEPQIAIASIKTLPLELLMIDLFGENDRSL